MLAWARSEYTAAESEVFSKDSANEPREAQEVRIRRIERLKIKIEEIGVGGEEILKEYKEVVERDQFFAKRPILSKARRHSIH